jgi:hypothetical protein
VRDVALVSFAYSAVDKDPVHNEVEMIVPVVREAVAQSGLPRADIGFTVSGSLDYLQGGPFAFVSGLDAVGAWPPIRESHVEMDAAWALYEAWVAIQTGEVDSAPRSATSMSDSRSETLQTDPYYVAALAVHGRHGRACYARTEESDRTSVTSPKSRRNATAAEPARGAQGRRHR